MRILITAGPTYEPIDPIRFLGNRSSGQMGAALARAASGSGDLNRAAAGHSVTLILGPVTAPMPVNVRRIDVFSSRDMHDAVLHEFPNHDLLIMAAAVSDFRPRSVSQQKTERGGTLTLELEATEDILAAAGRMKRPDQRTVGFSLVQRGQIERSREKLRRKNADLIVYNPLDTMSSATIESILLYPDGRCEELPMRAKAEFATILIHRAVALFRNTRVEGGG
ncbi:MAG TPA: phosphopantothenoylcysteine decarboxylase [Tepidisphaeraceae bacterium]|nr:phosphopantothenoylcysteine decarboxylase [Tepidisphaeraceae bacterium]